MRESDRGSSRVCPPSSAARSRQALTRSGQPGKASHVAGGCASAVARRPRGVAGSNAGQGPVPLNLCRNEQHHRLRASRCRCASLSRRSKRSSQPGLCRCVAAAHLDLVRPRSARVVPNPIDAVHRRTTPARISPPRRRRAGAHLNVPAPGAVAATARGSTEAPEKTAARAPQPDGPAAVGRHATKGPESPGSRADGYDVGPIARQRGAPSPPAGLLPRCPPLPLPSSSPPTGKAATAPRVRLRRRPAATMRKRRISADASEGSIRPGSTGNRLDPPRPAVSHVFGPAVPRCPLPRHHEARTSAENTLTARGRRDTADAS